MRIASSVLASILRLHRLVLGCGEQRLTIEAAFVGDRNQCRVIGDIAVFHPNGAQDGVRKLAPVEPSVHRRDHQIAGPAIGDRVKGGSRLQGTCKISLQRFSSAWR